MALSDYDNIDKILVQPGRLISAPTNLGLAFPHGGTSLGMTENGILLNMISNYEALNTEEKGIQPVKLIHLGEFLYIQVELVEWDDAVLDLLWDGRTTVGGSSGKKNVTWPGDGTYYAGKELSGRSIKLMFIPEDTDNNTILYAPKAVPVKPDQDMFLKTSEKTILILRFIIMEDTTISDGRANYRGLFIGDLSDVTL